MELAAKIIFWSITWYAIGFATMCYLRWVVNKNARSPQDYDNITWREVIVLGMLGFITLGFMVWNNIYVWWHERKLPAKDKD